MNVIIGQYYTSISNYSSYIKRGDTVEVLEVDVIKDEIIVSNVSRAYFKVIIPYMHLHWNFFELPCAPLKSFDDFIGNGLAAGFTGPKCTCGAHVTYGKSCAPDMHNQDYCGLYRKL